MTARLQSTAVLRDVEARMAAITRTADLRSALRYAREAMRRAAPRLLGCHGPLSVEARERLEAAISRVDDVLRGTP